MNKDDFTLIIPLLLKVAEDYFNGKKVETNHGICAALTMNIQDASIQDPYRIMQELMQELNYASPTKFGPYTYGREAWEPRAWMCLFLAEYLKGRK